MTNLALPKIRGEYRFDYNLAHLTWFKVGGRAKVFFKPEDIDDLVFFLQNYDGKMPIHTLGAGSNTIIRDNGFDGIIIKLTRQFTEIEILDGNRIKAGSGTLNFNLANFCLQNSIKGFEFLIGIPGSIGGGIAMNAGSYGVEFKDILLEATCVNLQGKIKHIKLDEFGFGYRCHNIKEDLIFLEATFHYKRGEQSQIKHRMDEITNQRKKTQPTNQKTGGSTFANPTEKKAWQLIENAGLRGHKIGGACFSSLHCNFMINDGNAKASDLENLGELARKKVKDQTGFNLSWEIKIIGKK